MKAEIKNIIEELIEYAKLPQESILVVGCSTSEVVNEKIGTNSKEEIGDEIFHIINDICMKNKKFLACQCCEHLNRALVVEKELAIKKNLEIVSVIHQIKAGGAFATSAYKNMKNPVVVEFIKADAGVDIGNTLIGMHLKHVAVPYRTKIKNIGGASVVTAYTRPKLIGGERAKH